MIVDLSVIPNSLKRGANAGLLVGGNEHGSRPALEAFMLDPNGVRACAQSYQLKRCFADMLLIDEHGGAGRYGLDS